MSRPIMRRLAASLLTLSCLLIAPSPVAAQEEAAPVRLTLLSQTPWSSTGQRVIELRFRAQNLGDAPLPDLTIGLTLYARVVTRTAFEQSLAADPSVVIDAETFAREGMLEPGQSRDFEVSFQLDSAGIDPDQSGIYPLKVDLRSSFASLAAIRTPVVFLVRDPEQPLALSWTFIVDHPIAFRPDGIFTSTSLETSLAPGGRLSGTIRALRALATEPPQPPVDVAVSPVLLTQLGRMRGGYQVLEGDELREVPQGEGASELAAQAIEDLRTIAAAPNVRLSSLPFSEPELPSLVAGGLPRDLGVQLERGRRVVESFLQTPPGAGVLRPPAAALDDATVKELAATGIGALIVGPDTVETSPQPLGFAGSPTAALGETGLLAIVPEPAIASLVDGPLVDQDPVLAAQVVLGLLASIWQERPGEARGIAIVLPEDLTLPGPLFTPLARALAGAPWLSPTPSAELALAFPPTEPSTLAVHTPRLFPATYVDQLKQARRRVQIYRSLLVDESDEPDRLETQLLLAESRQFLETPEEGLAFIASVRDTVGAVFGAISLETADVVTLTSSSGSGIPVTVSNRSEDRLRLTVRLVSQNLRSTPSIELELGPGSSETLRFTVSLKTTGRFPVQAQVISPNGRVIEEHTLIVRSTVYNRIALYITIGAALVLLALWARRFVPRPAR